MKLLKSQTQKLIYMISRKLIAHLTCASDLLDSDSFVSAYLKVILQKKKKSFSDEVFWWLNQTHAALSRM